MCLYVDPNQVCDDRLENDCSISLFMETVSQQGRCTLTHDMTVYVFSKASEKATNAFKQAGNIRCTGRDEANKEEQQQYHETQDNNYETILCVRAKLDRVFQSMQMNILRLNILHFQYS